VTPFGFGFNSLPYCAAFHAWQSTPKISRMRQHLSSVRCGPLYHRKRPTDIETAQCKSLADISSLACWRFSLQRAKKETAAAEEDEAKTEFKYISQCRQKELAKFNKT